MIKELLVMTFSGGRTSAFMAQYVNNNKCYDNYDKIFIFANTGKEKEETLEFIDKCDKEWNLDIVWVEAKVIMEKGKGTTFKIVDFKTASRNGEPFEAMLQKYPIPTVFASNYTRELKEYPINKYIKSLGSKKYITAIGIRYDEQHRRSNTAKERNIIYPLMDDFKCDEKFIRYWWEKQPFDLGIKDYQGNCDLCFKKSVRKRLTLIDENPKIADWWLKMEEKHSNDVTPRFDLRSNKSIEKLIEMSKLHFRKIRDKHELSKEQLRMFDNVNLDYETDCFCKAN